MLRFLLLTSGSLARAAARGEAAGKKMMSAGTRSSPRTTTRHASHHSSHHLLRSTNMAGSFASSASKASMTTTQAATQATSTTLLTTSASRRAFLETLGARGGSSVVARRVHATRDSITSPPRYLLTNKSFWSGAGRGASGRGGGGGGGGGGGLFNTVKRVGAAVALPFVVAWKYKMAALSALKLTKLSSLASLAMTTAGYAWLFGVPYGVGVTVQILLHESGHALALMRYGVPFQPMVFVPFMGQGAASSYSSIHTRVLLFPT